MKPLKKLLDKVRPHFEEEDGRFRLMYPLFEAADTFLFSPGNNTRRAPHVRDAMDLKRMMILVVIALTPCLFMAMYNTGLQASRGMEALVLTDLPGWRYDLLSMLGLSLTSSGLIGNIVYGALWFLPIYIVTVAVGGAWEALFSTVRKHEINEGFLVTSLLLPLTLPPTIPLWQVALGVSFGVVVGKEIFGGTGRNVLNPALTGRIFLYFAYPAQITGDSVWTAIDGFSGATPLGALAVTDVATGMEAIDVTWMEAFLGTIQGSMGETSTLACLLGALFLIVTGIGSWRIMVAMLIGGLVTSTFFYLIGSETNAMFQMSPAWHMVTGGFAFGLVFMATDPVSAAMTDQGRWIYGILIGVLTILIRVVNPAYPEGVMLAILFGNVFAPAIDYVFIQKNIKRRIQRYGA
jgi:Na+-transporting NADH:ubiquinone oxidoreductase subunit B